jgi:hypothetical protein
MSIGDTSLKTVASNMNGLLSYAKFLEHHQLHWLTCPVRKADRCLVRYRGALIKMRDSGQLGGFRELKMMSRKFAGVGHP